MSYTQLTQQQRYRIYALRKGNHSQRAGQPNESIFILTNLANGGVSGVQQSPF